MATHRYQRQLLVGILILVFFWGCAPLSEHYKSGQQLSQEKRWEEAIGYFEKALQEEPNRQEYQDALKQARQEAAKIQLGRARAALNAAPDRNIPALEAVARLVERAARLDATNKDIMAIQGDVRQRLTNLNNVLRSLYSQSEEDMKKEDWTKALSKLVQVNEIFPNYEDTGARIAKIRQEGPKKYYQQGQAAAKQEDWKAAAQAFKIALDINANFFDVAKLYQEAVSKDNAEYFIAAADKATKAANWEKAIALYEKAVEYHPRNQLLTQTLDALRDRVGQIFLDEATTLARQGRFYPAVKKLELIATLAPSFQDEPVYLEFINRFCATLLSRADRFIERERFGNALLWLERIEIFRPNYPNLFEKMIEVKDQINRRIRKSIAVFDFGSPSYNKDAGRIVANKLIAFLHKNASGDLRIIERENLQSILREVQLGQTGVLDVKAAQTAKMKGIDTFIMGDVLAFFARTTDNYSQNQVRAPVGEEDIPNPAFSRWQHLHPNPSREERLQAPPPTTKRPVMQIFSYKQGIARITAMFETSYKLVDTSTGENILTATVPGRLIKEDKYQDPVGAANIPHDPLDLPTEAEVLDELTNDKCAEIGRNILKQFQSLEVEYFNQGELQRRRRSNEMAIERYIDAIYIEKLKGMTTPVTEKSWELVDSLIQNM